MSFDRPLWAPWRIAFIRGEKSGRCFLCRNESVREGTQEESLLIARGRHCFVMLNRYPYNPGHLLIAPYRHTGDLAALTTDEMTELMTLCARGKTVLDGLMQPAGYNAGFNLGSAAGAGVADHLHMHLVPRWVGDTNFMPVLADTRCIPEALEETAESIRNSWS